MTSSQASAVAVCEARFSACAPMRYTLTVVAGEGGQLPSS